MSNDKSINAERVENVTPETRKIGPGDQVQIKGAAGPKMTVIGADPERGTHVECVYWDTSRQDCDRFESVYVHRDALAYFGDAVPTPPGAIKPDFQFGGGQHGGLPQGAIGVVHGVDQVILDPMTPVGTILYPGKIAPVTQPRATVETAVRNLKRMIEIRSNDSSLMLYCLSVISVELMEHVDIEGVRC